MSPTYRLKAEPGKFGLEGQGIGGPGESPFPIQGDQIIVGVVAMHNMLISMAKALHQSQNVLIQLQAMDIHEETKLDMARMGININLDWLEVIIHNNAELLEQVNLEAGK